MEVSDATKLRALEDENAKLKRLLSDSMLSNDVLKDFLGNGPDTLPCRCSVGSTVALVLPMECRDGAKT
jgi:hypothetical protein